MVRDETPEQRRAHELFQCYRSGWRHGALAKAYDTRFTGHAREDIRRAYGRGYDAGRDAATLAGAHEAERLGYDPRMSILREAPPVDPPATPSEGKSDG